MAAYMVAHIDVKDPVGRFPVRGARTEVLEGACTSDGTVVLLEGVPAP